MPSNDYTRSLWDRLKSKGKEVKDKYGVEEDVRRCILRVTYDIEKERVIQLEGLPPNDGKDTREDHEANEAYAKRVEANLKNVFPKDLSL